MTACKWVIHFVLNSGSANDSTRFSRTNQRNVFDLCFGIWKHEAIFPHAAFFRSHIFFFNLSSFSQTPLPEWEWKVRANQGVIAHHASQCYSECCPWFRVPDPKKTQSSRQSTGTDFNARLPFLLQVMQLWGEFSRGPLKKLTAPPSALPCRSQMMTFLAVTVLRVLIVSVCPHLIIYPWVSEAVFHVFLPLHHFLDGSFLGASAYFTAAILLPSSFIIQMHLKVSCCFISPQGMRPLPPYL